MTRNNRFMKHLIMDGYAQVFVIRTPLIVQFPHISYNVEVGADNSVPSPWAGF